VHRQLDESFSQLFRRRSFLEPTGLLGACEPVRTNHVELDTGGRRSVEQPFGHRYHVRTVQMEPSGVIVVGITGGIAAYKAAEVVRALDRAGREVHVMMTPAATEFVSPLTFAALVRRPVLTQMFPNPELATGQALYPHLQPAERADAFLVCPATADAIARLAVGMANDVVTAAALSLPAGCHRFFAPAMNDRMWANPIVRENARRLESWGWVRIGPGSGALACGAVGEGRMADPEQITEVVLRTGHRLVGQRWLVLSGPTREPIDAVRFVSNASSGRMGQAVALAAAAEGAKVVFITGPVEPERWPVHPSVEIHSVRTAREMLEAAATMVGSADVVVFAAAVADMAPASPATVKLSKRRLGPVLRWAPTPDIAASLPRRGGQTRIGFALESEDGRASAARKLQTKHLDAIVLNRPESIGASEAEFEFLEAGKSSTWESWGRLSKDACARRLVEWVIARRSCASESSFEKG